MSDLSVSNFLHQMNDDLAAARARISELEGALLTYCRHAVGCEMEFAIPADAENWYKCTCGLARALAPTEQK